MCYVDLLSVRVSTLHMNPALNRSSALQLFEHGKMFEIRN